MGRLLDHLIANREIVLDCLARHRARNPRVFGSVARGEEAAASDVDLLVEFDEEASLFDLFELQDELAQLLTRPVEVATVGGLHPMIREAVIREARAL